MNNEVLKLMLRLFLPSEYVKSIFHISPRKLKESGIKGIITDLDNTLVEWDRPNATPQLLEWFKEVKDQGMDITIVSNNNEKRVKAFSEPLNIKFIHKARKPMGQAFLRAAKKMNLKKAEVVVIGDQLLTDVLGGNRTGFQTILVVPVASTDGFFTRINRKIERRIMESLKRKGMLQWEE
jgi:HAD superfamily phosphatase (TIGR01668 family)